MNNRILNDNKKEAEYRRSDYYLYPASFFVFLSYRHYGELSILVRLHKSKYHLVDIYVQFRVE